VRPDHLIGLVVAIQRGSREHTVWGGLVGRLIGTALRLVRMIEDAVIFLLYPLYMRLSRSGILRRCMSDRLKTHLILFQRTEGMELQLLLGRRVIARRLPGTIRWQVRRPFRLIVDEASLPVTPSNSDSVSPPRLIQ
jgi:hypothetical protein